MISIICVYNDQRILETWLMASLKNQDTDYELVLLDNRGSQYGSAAEALNKGAKQSSGDYLLFAHQDVFLYQNDWLSIAESLLNNSNDVGVAGVAGMQRGEASILTIGKVRLEYSVGTIYHGTDKVKWKSGIADHTEKVRVQTLDEQLLIVPRKVFDANRFDQYVCDNWHLYGVDYSLAIAKKNLKAYVLPLSVWHRSTGYQWSYGYFSTLNKVLSKHQDALSVMTTTGQWFTAKRYHAVYLLLKGLRSGVGKFMGRNKVGAMPFLKSLRELISM